MATFDTSVHGIAQITLHLLLSLHLVSVLVLVQMVLFHFSLSVMYSSTARMCRGPNCRCLINFALCILNLVQVTPTDEVKRMIKGGELSGEYVLEQLHFHWGKKGHDGSEHKVDGRQYDMEAHLVHTGANNSIAVIAILMKKRFWKNEKLEPIIQSLRDVGYKNENSTLQSDRFKLLDLLPPHANCFYRYSGSLTTPGCTEGVIWSVLKTPVGIGYEQIQKFWNLKSTERSLPSNKQCSLQNNYRPTQDLNGRQVFSTHC